MEGERASAEISSNKKEFAAMFQQGDAFALTFFYTEDARILPPNSDPVEGHRAIQVFWQSLMDLGIEYIQKEGAEMDIVQDTAIDMSRFSLIGSEFSVVDVGHHIAIWKQVAGEWKISKDIFNSNRPAQ